MIGSARRLSVKTPPVRYLLFSWPRTPYLGVRTNSLGFLRIASQMASSTALALLSEMPTPRPMRTGMYRSDFQPASLPNSSRWLKTKNVLAEQVARTNRLAEKMYCDHDCALNGLRVPKKVGNISTVRMTIS